MARPREVAPAPGANERRAAAALLAATRWASLATIADDGAPLATQVAYAMAPDGEALLLHLSLLAEHARNLDARPRASIVVAEPDSGDGDPQTLARVSLSGGVVLLEPGSAAHDIARAAYVRRFPAAEMRFGLGDFRLLRLEPLRGHLVGGFARARTLSRDDALAIVAAARRAGD
ncbi:MAG: pyridoxamine 5'-phosphate oxidase family protein [Ectothiorhodospiraceae bacterium]|nr:pyridoxamine 5'-phosphate oxidase family protein [Chromatiales bacterium]MCP5153633.1 pyridoxamine 5'-phosphate oxidase family protein [Ectothiorhodospiraceae bacterium]